MTYASNCTRIQAEMIAIRLILNGTRAELVTDKHIADAAACLYPGLQSPSAVELCSSLIYASTHSVLRRGLANVDERTFVMFAGANLTRCICSRQAKSTDAIAEELDVLLKGFTIPDRPSKLHRLASQERYLNFTPCEKQLLNELEPLLLNEINRRKENSSAVPAGLAADASSKRDERIKRVLQLVEAQLVLMDLLVYLCDVGTSAVPDEDGKDFFLQVLRESPSYHNCSDEKLCAYFDTLTEADHALLSCGGNIADTIDKQFSLLAMLSLLTAMTELPVADTPRMALVEAALPHMENFHLHYDADRMRRSMSKLAYRHYCAGDMVPAAVIERLHAGKAISLVQFVKKLYTESLNDFETRIEEEVASKLAAQRAFDAAMHQLNEQQRMKDIFADLCIQAQGGPLGSLAMGAHGQCSSSKELQIYIRILLQKLEKHGLCAQGLEWLDRDVVATPEMSAACVDENGNWVTPGQRYSLLLPGWKYQNETLVHTIMKHEKN